MKNGSWLPEEEDFKGLSDNFFDDLINHIDFPLEDIETTNDDEGDWDAGFEDLVPPPLDVLTNLFSSGNTCKGQRRGIHKPVPISKQSSSSEVSSTIDNSSPDGKVSKLSQSSTLVSVLENSNGCALSRNQNRAQGLAFLVKGIRSKRKRATPLRIISLHSFCSEMCQQVALNESECETYLPFENPAKKKRKKNKAHSVSYSPEPFNSDGTSRICTHCETTKTPQWRAGPCGPKTLCNACGVRFRSGRLLPEYRPASSPTFVPTMHSNSHRKIIEMRRKGDEQFDTGMIHTVSSQA